MYIYHVDILVNGREDLNLEAKIDACIQQCLNSYDAALVATKSEELYGENLGKCVVCGDWVSDSTKDNRISSFSDGAQVEGRWYCDLCLPNDHPKYFG